VEGIGVWNIRTFSLISRTDRQAVSTDATTGWRSGNWIAAVGAAGLVYDLLVRTRELPAALATVRGHPGVQVVVDHAAKPRIAQGVWDSAWEEALAPLGSEPNVTCKISGLVTEADWKSWTREQLRPYVKRVLEWFGPDRCMFGSDWPVCLLAADYAEVIAAMREIVGGDDDVFGGTATRVYGLAGRNTER